VYTWLLDFQQVVSGRSGVAADAHVYKGLHLREEHLEQCKRKPIVRQWLVCCLQSNKVAARGFVAPRQRLAVTAPEVAPFPDAGIFPLFPKIS
jgi:hypothetical protein